MLRNVAFAAALILATLSISLEETKAGSDMSAGQPEDQLSAGRYEPRYNTREYYRAPYGAEYGYAYGRSYIFGSYYRPYRTHYYSYSYPNYYTHYYSRRRGYRWYDRVPGYRAPYSGYSYRYR